VYHGIYVPDEKYQGNCLLDAAYGFWT
jgi:hypothetical protein